MTSIQLLAEVKSTIIKYTASSCNARYQDLIIIWNYDEEEKALN